jgi:hypothetical protein
MNQDGIWLSILDYASVKKTSISTIRRSIKSGHLKFREENGKYFIWTREAKKNSSEESINMSNSIELENYKKLNRELVEEINDLKMLLSVYENQHNVELPPIPVIEQ